MKPILVKKRPHIWGAFRSSGWSERIAKIYEAITKEYPSRRAHFALFKTPIYGKPFKKGWRRPSLAVGAEWVKGGYRINNPGNPENNFTSFYYKCGISVV